MYLLLFKQSEKEINCCVSHWPEMGTVLSFVEIQKTVEVLKQESFHFKKTICTNIHLDIMQSFL